MGALLTYIKGSFCSHEEEEIYEPWKLQWGIKVGESLGFNLQCVDMIWKVKNPLKKSKVDHFVSGKLYLNWAITWKNWCRHVMPDS